MPRLRADRHGMSYGLALRLPAAILPNCPETRCPFLGLVIVWVDRTGETAQASAPEVGRTPYRNDASRQAFCGPCHAEN